MPAPLRFLFAPLSTSLFALALHATALAGDAITGAGSSAAAPVYRIWAAAYEKEHAEAFSYDPVGSGAGMASIRKRAVDLGASDVIAPRAELDHDGLVMVPTVITGIVPVVNLPGVAPGALRLSGELLAAIFLGEITRWDGPPLKALNPGLRLPGTPIRLVVRADSSGTTYHLSDYLSRTSPAWKQRYGVASKFAWPGGAIAVKGSAQVSRTLRATPGAIGYIDFNYVLDDGLTGVSMKNADGQFVAPTVEGFRQAVTHSAWFSRGDFSSEINDQPGPMTWPITMGTYVAVPRVSTQPERTERALRFITWGYLHGDTLARDAKFVPLPVKVQASAYREIETVSSAGGERLGTKVLARLLR